MNNLDVGPHICIPIQNIESGPILPSHFDVSKEPLEYFQLYFDATVINHTQVVMETKHFATERKQKQILNTKYARLSVWQNCTDFDMKAFIGTIINMGLHHSPDIIDYFSDV